MPSFSFDESAGSKPICIAKGGSYDGLFLYLNDNMQGHSKKGMIQIPAHKYKEELKQYKPTERVKILTRFKEALEQGKTEVEEEEPLKELYKKIKDAMDGEISITLPPDSMFQLIASPDPKKRDVFYICGASGSGKSHIARNIAESYRAFFPKREIYLISKLMQDDTLDNMKGGKPKRINVDSLLTDPMDIEEVRDSMVIIDDVDAFDKDRIKAVMQLLDDIAITGRHTNTSLLFLTHHITNYSKTRLILNESTHYVVYPQTTSYHSLKHLLTSYAGLDPEYVKGLRKWGSRWVCVHKNFPTYIISQHKAVLPHEED